MMTSSNGNIFRVTGHLCGEFTGLRWIPRTKASDAEFDVFFDLRRIKWLSKQPWGWWFETQSWSLWRHCNVPRWQDAEIEFLEGLNLLKVEYEHIVALHEITLAFVGKLAHLLSYSNNTTKMTSKIVAHCLWHCDCCYLSEKRPWTPYEIVTVMSPI